MKEEEGGKGEDWGREKDVEEEDGRERGGCEGGEGGGGGQGNKGNFRLAQDLENHINNTVSAEY